jgi:hypothetical protein
MVTLTTWKSTTPILVGSNCSNGTRMKELSLITVIREFLMLPVVKTKKPPMFKFGRRTAQKPKNGSLSTPKMLKSTRPRD